MNKFAPYILGTVQLGLPYGIANTHGQPSQNIANSIIDQALSGGINYFDTAQNYGQSETVLGLALSRKQTEQVNIITKLPHDLTSSRDLEQLVRSSLKKIGISQLYCLMFHREEHFELLLKLAEPLLKLKEKGLYKYLGISTYSPDLTLKLLEHPLIDIIQLPSSLFDRRFASAFKLAAKLNKQIHIRSALLQGVLTMQVDKLPNYLAELAPCLEKLHSLCQAFNISTPCGALGWLSKTYPECFVIFGAETPKQVQENIAFPSKWAELPLTFWDKLDEICPPQTPNLLNPALWPK